MKNLNPYKIKWAILTPQNGTALKIDEITVNKFTMNWRNRKEADIIIHSPNQTLLNKKIESLRGKLNKSYNVLFITGKQFGLRKENQSFLDIATKRQVLDQFIIC